MTVTALEFEELLLPLMPKLRAWAMAMTRNHAASEDLVQDVATKAWAARDTFASGTNFGAWMRRIMVNQFITNIRTQRDFVAMEFMPDISINPSHEDLAALRELSWAVNRLPLDQREALLMIVVDEDSYQTASERTGCAVGTLKSRVHRARLQLRENAA